MRVQPKLGRSLLAVVALSSAALWAMACEKSPSTSEVAAKKEIERAVERPAAVRYLKHGSQETVTVSLLRSSEADALAAKPKIVPIVKKHFPGATRLDVKPSE